MRRAYALIIGATVLSLSATAHANTGIGFLTVSIPFLVMALVPAILVEAPILSRILQVSLGRGLWWSFVANVVSTILGALIGLAADLLILAPTGSSGMPLNRSSAIISLVPMFFIT